MSERIKRVNELIKQEVGQLLLREVDFGKSLVTITDVETSSDLKYAKIEIVIYPEKETQKVFKILGKNIYDIQQGLNKRLGRNLKWVPKIRFEIDKGESNAQNFERILKGLK